VPLRFQQRLLPVRSFGFGLVAFLLEIGPRRFGSRDKGPQVAADGPGFLKAQGTAKCRHDCASAFKDDARQLGVGPRVLPTLIGEVGDAGDVPDAAAVHAVAADAVLVEESHDDGLFLLRTSHPVPGRAWLFGQQVARDALRTVGGATLAAAPAQEMLGMRLVHGNLKEEGARAEEQTGGRGSNNKSLDGANASHDSGPAHLWSWEPILQIAKRASRDDVYSIGKKHIPNNCSSRFSRYRRSNRCLQNRFI